MSFEWQTEEDYNWDNEPEPQPKPPRRRPRWLWFLLLLPLLLIGGGWFAFRQVNQRVELVAERTKEEILASHHLLQTAVSNRDSDLFISFLSGREPDWAFGLEEAVRKSMYRDRPQFGLTWLPDALPQTPTVQNISPDLAAAEVTHQQAYQLPVGNGVVETIHLQYTDIYRLGPNRWLLAPPEPDYWGDMLVHRGTILHLTYPERDKQIARQLAVDLDEKLLQACTQLAALRCRPNLTINVLLSTNPTALTTDFGGDGLTFALDDIRLPTPSLIGSPIDEAGYQALLRGYAGQLVSALVANATGWECCRYVHLYQALLDRELLDLGLRPWPLLSEMYDDLAKRPFTLTTLQPFWGIDLDTRNIADLAPVYALVEFIDTEFTDLSLVELQTSLQRFPNQTAAEWLLTATATNGRYDTAAELELALYRFVTQRSTPTNSPNPDQQLLALCSNNGQQQLYQHDPASGTTSQKRTQSIPFATMLGLPDDSGIVMAEYSDRASINPHTFIWQDGREQPIVHRDGITFQTMLPLATSPNGRWLLLQLDNNLSTPFALLPLDTCSSQTLCTATPLLGQPIWSPSGSQTLNWLTVDTNTQRRTGLIFVGNAQGSALDYLAEGHAPFWFDNETIAFSPNGRTIVTQQLSTSGRTTLVSTLDLISTLATVDQPSAGAVIIDHLLWLPNADDTLLIITADPTGQAGQSYLFAYETSTEEATLLQVLDTQRQDRERHYRLSPNGRFLAIDSYNGRNWRLYLYDLHTNSLRVLQEGSNSRPAPTQLIDWSADGNWLTLPQDGYLRLLSLAGDETERPLFIGNSYCQTAVWYTP